MRGVRSPRPQEGLPASLPTAGPDQPWLSFMASRPRLKHSTAAREQLDRGGRAYPPPSPYSPSALAAFSRKSEPSRMYRRSIAVPLWPVCSAMTRSGTPAAAAEVARPARSECPACAVPEPFAWAGWARASCGSAILVDQTAEYLSSADRGGQVDHLTRIVDGRPLFPTLVWTVAVS